METQPKLTIELVPKTSHYKNLRSELDVPHWNKLRKETYRKAGYRCEICGGKGNKWPVECHEVWTYDEEKKIQKLERLIALCPACHEVKHLGRAQKTGNYKSAIEHLKKVNSWTDKQVSAYVEQVKKDYLRKSLIDWKLDISFIE